MLLHKTKMISSLLSLYLSLLVNHHLLKQANAMNNERRNHHLRAQHQQGAWRRRSGTEFEKMRIRINTDELERGKGYSDRDDSRIDALIDDILPESVKIWSEALSVRPLIDPVVLDDDECGGVPVPSNDQSHGVEDADLIVYVGLEDDCSGNTFARAGSCLYEEELDRPIAGRIKICLDEIDLDDDDQVSDEDIELHIGVHVHEIGHILGISTYNFSLYRKPNGEPWGTTERTVTCANGETKTMDVPNVLTEEDGVWEIRTLAVVQVVRNQFDCQSLTGARLENQSSSNCFSSHLDERYFFNDVMGKTVHMHNMLTPVTLAILEDSGWYQPDYTKSTIASFGHGAGCNFVHKDCIVDGDVPDYSRGFFCNELWSSSGASRQCDATHTIRASCDLRDDEEPPKDFEWFEDEDWGGSFTRADHCPLNRYWTEHCNEDTRCFNVEDDDSVCLEFECKQQQQRVTFDVDGTTFTCDEDFEVVETSIGNVVCPRFAAICPEAVCPGNCSGRGVCDWDSGTCECDDKDDDSAGCWDSLFSASSGGNGGGAGDNQPPVSLPSASPTASPTKEKDAKDNNDKDKDKDKGGKDKQNKKNKNKNKSKKKKQKGR